MKKMKIAALLCVAALLVLVLAACGGNEPGPEPEPDPTTEPAVQTADPVKDTEGTDYSALVGDWYEETGYGMLTVYENGGFRMDAIDGVKDGYLVFTDEDGDMWENGPRYEMYLENNERVPGTFLAFDDNHPGELAYVMGGGAQLFSRDMPLPPAGEPAIEVGWPEDVLTWYANYDEFEAIAEEPQVQLVFTSTGVVRDFTVLALTLQDVSEDGKPVFLMEELYSQDMLAPWRPLAVDTVFYGDIPNNGVSYVDENGLTHCFTVSMSGEDGSLQLIEM